MKKILKYFLIVCWLLVASMVFAYVWIRTPVLWFITLPDVVWEFLLDAFNVSCCEGVADFEFVVAHVFGFIFSSIMLFLFLWIRKWLRKSQNRVADAEY